MSEHQKTITTEQALFLRDFLFPAIEEESKATAKVLASIPEDKSDYRPDEKSRSARDLAWHIISSELHFLDSINQGVQVGGEDPPQENRTIAEMIDYYQQAFAAGAEKLKALSVEQLARPVRMYEMFDYPAVHYLTFLQSHTIHHRGQLCAYLRPMGAKVPAIYGPSGDETWGTGEAASA